MIALSIVNLEKKFAKTVPIVTKPNDWLMICKPSDSMMILNNFYDIIKSPVLFYDC